MFPDSDIAKAYHQKRNKVKYILQFGIAPVMQRKLLAELKDQPLNLTKLRRKLKKTV